MAILRSTATNFSLNITENENPAGEGGGGELNERIFFEELLLLPR